MGSSFLQKQGIRDPFSKKGWAALAFDPLNVRKLFKTNHPGTPFVAPATQTVDTSLIDQGQREEASKHKGFAQAIYAADTGGWQSGTGSLFGKASPTNKPLLQKLGGT